MIERMEIAGVATFGPAPVILDELSTFNYFYGSNGSGKTTISRVIADPTGYPDCAVQWKGGVLLEPLAYNRDFVDRHFRASDELPGIFTLGERDAEAADKIAAAKKDCDRIGQEIVALKRTLEGVDGTGGKLGELAVAEDAFKEACWKQKHAHDDRLKVAFEGYRNKSEAFKTKVLDECKNNKADKKTLDYILKKAETVFADDATKVAPLTVIDGTTLLACERSPILQKKILGKSDVDIAAMIQQLGNSDWVREGRAFLAANGQACPFCQQAIASGFEESLNAYFDESFEADSRAVMSLEAKYAADVAAFSTALDTLLANPLSFLDHTTLAAKKKLFDAQAALNQQRLVEKKKEPSRVVELNSLDALIVEIEAIVDSANQAIDAHNRAVANLAEERQTLKAQVWRFLIDEPLKQSIATYDRKKGEIDKAIANLNKQIREKDVAKREKEEEIRGLERDVTSIQPTVDAINALLASFGFHGFSLSQSDNKRCYKTRAC